MAGPEKYRNLYEIPSYVKLGKNLIFLRRRRKQAGLCQIHRPLIPAKLRGSAALCPRVTGRSLQCHPVRPPPQAQPH